MSNAPSILYEVSIRVDESIRADYLHWLREHMTAMLEIDGFASADLFIDTEDENQFVCHYRLRDSAAMDAYLAGPAKAMRADGMNRFGDKFSASRRILRSEEA